MNSPIYLPADTPPEEIPEPSADRIVHVLAGTRQRFMAKVVDLAAIGLTVVAVVAGSLAPDLAVGAGGFDAAWSIGTLVLTIASVAVLRVARLVWWGCSVGQRVVGLRVVSQEDGGTPGWKQAFDRWLIAPDAVYFPGVSDFLAHREDKRYGRCLHDRRAGTVVVQARPPLVPAETGGLTAPKPEEEAPPLVPDAAWARRERWHRVILGSVIGIALTAVVALPLL